MRSQTGAASEVHAAATGGQSQRNGQLCSSRAVPTMAASKRLHGSEIYTRASEVSLVLIIISLSGLLCFSTLQRRNYSDFLCYCNCRADDEDAHALEGLQYQGNSYHQ